MRVFSLVRWMWGLSSVVLAAGVLLAPTAAAAGFGVEPGSLVAGAFQADGNGPLDEGAMPDSQAGDHPYEMVTGFKLNTMPGAGEPGISVPVGNEDVRDVVLNSPAGFVGDPNAVPQCSGTPGPDFCSSDTVIGEAYVGVTKEDRAYETFFTPIYNMKPGRGQLALFAFHVGDSLDITTFLHVRVRSTGDYGVSATASDISQLAQVLETRVVLWGVPADPSHDPYRGVWEAAFSNGCLEELTGLSVHSCPSDVPPRALLTNPTLCDGQPTTSTLITDSWLSPGRTIEGGSPDLSDPSWLAYADESPALTGCEKLVFDPSLTVVPETSAVDTPSGMNLDLHVPQNENPYGLATPELRDATVALPAGMAISPSAANGLEGCTPEEVGVGTEKPVACPDASKLAVARVRSSALPLNADGSEGELTGSVYLGAPAAGPVTRPPYTIYLVVEGYGLSVRLAGSAEPDPGTGRLTATFTENPQLPFDDLRLEFFGGPRAALATPPACGSYTTSSSLVPYSSSVAATPPSSFQTSFDGSGAPCPSPLPFAPSSDAGSTSTTAGAFTPFVLNVERPDGQQALSGISLSTPPGLLGVLTGVPLCGESQAAQGTCPAASQIGTATAGAGAGPEPFTVSGPAYLTGPYRGAPFGLSIAVPAIAGPFNLGTVVVRSAIYVDPHDGHLVVVSDPLPQMVNTSQGDSGIPVDLQSVSVDVNRPAFTFNPTNCTPTAVGGALSSNQGASAALSSPFQVTSCASLGFHPKFSVSSSGHASRPNGASLDVKLLYPTAPRGSQANIAKVKVDLPKQLPSRLTTLQKACTAAVFEANPANCPAASVVGHATATTPILPVPVSGPAYFVSHGGEAFPSLIVVLQGYGVTIDLVGATFISKAGITSSTFNTVPDVPVSTFELSLPQGKYSALAANGNLCKSKLVMPTAFIAQNGAQIKQSTPIIVTGCSKAKVAKPKPKRKGKLAKTNAGAHKS